jgi:glycosyltransferase involved in cell wall biosynthesis
VTGRQSSQGEGALPTISVVIPTRGRPRLVARTLAAVLADPATSEAVVVVDGHDPETEDTLDGYARDDARVRIAHAPAAAGVPRGEQRVRDHGAALARSDVILALDDDIVAAPGLVSGHAGWHATDGDVVVLGYMPVAPPPAGRRWSAANRLYAESYERACDEFEAHPDSILAGMWGGNFSVRREHWLRADELEKVSVDFMHTDREFGLRLRQLGLRARFDRRLQALHHDERDVTRLAAAARGSAVAHVRLRRAYADLTLTDERRGSRWPIVALLVLTRPPRVWGLTLEVLCRLTGFAHSRNLTTVEYALTRLVWRLAHEREIANARDALASAGS